MSGYSADSLKKEYRENYDTQRGKNLSYLRNDIAGGINMHDFNEIIGISKKDLSLLENGKKNPSLFHILAYKKYFKENFNINVSTDYLMGFTDKITNEDEKDEHEDIFISERLGLKIQTIEKIKNYDEEYKELIDRLSLNKSDDLLKKLLKTTLRYARNEHDYYSVNNRITKEEEPLDKKDNEIIKKAITTDNMSSILTKVKELYMSDNKKDMDNYIKDLEKFKEDYLEKEKQKRSD